MRYYNYISINAYRGILASSPYTIPVFYIMRPYNTYDLKLKEAYMKSSDLLLECLQIHNIVSVCEYISEQLSSRENLENLLNRVRQQRLVERSWLILLGNR
jgi:hypothetical protein